MKNIYITWHYTTHGIAYLKHILSHFYLLNKIPDKIDFEKLDQEILNTTFDNEKQNGITFDEIVYLVAPQEAFDGLSTRRFSYKKMILEDDLIIKNGLYDVYEHIISNDDICYNLEKEIELVKSKFPEKRKIFMDSIWRNIQHYPIKEQTKWLLTYSNFNNVYKNKLKIIELNINDLRNENLIAIEMNKWSSQYFASSKNIQPLINISLGSNETQVVWHVLYEAGRLPSNSRFIKTYDDKKDKIDKKFKQFSITETPTNLISNIKSNIKIYKNTNSAHRRLVNLKMNAFLNSGFTILLIGERGIGKSRIVSSAFNKGGNLIQANCASFDIDSKAESEFFGYEKGAFTGANELRKGLLEEANNGILFLDEIHHLSKFVQAKLMKAFQTDSQNKMSIRRMGSTKEIKVECRLIFATNKSVAELRKELLPDFYDRIVQHVIYLPPLRETIEDRESDWKLIWDNLQVKQPCPMDNELLNWLKELPLYGNYRDLHKIAIYYNVFQNFNADTINLLSENTPFEYAKNEFEKYHSLISNEKDSELEMIFSNFKTASSIDAEIKYKLQNWAINKYGDRNKAAKKLDISVKTLSNWKNKLNEPE